MRFGYVDKQDRAERPVGLAFQMDGPSLADDSTLYDAHRLPRNEYQALMEADFLEEPEMDEATAEAMWLAFSDKVHSAGLTDRELLVVECIVWGGMSLATTGQYLARELGQNRAVPKQSVQRIRDKAFDKLRGVFSVDQAQ